MESNLTKKYKYIYNKEQSIYFIQQGAECVDVDVNPSSNKIYFRFLNNDKIQELYGKWANRNS